METMKSPVSICLRACVAVLIAMLATLAAINAGAASEPRNPEGAPLRLVAAIPLDIPPTYFRDEATGKASGFAVDVMNELGRRSGFTVEYVFGKPWDELIDMVRTGKADLVPSLTISPEREGVIVFTDPIETVPVNLIVRADSRITGLAPDLTIGTIAGSAPEIILRRDHPSIKIKSFTDFQGVLFALLAGHIDAALVLTPSLLKFAMDAGVEGKIKVISPPVYEARRGIALRQDDTLLLARLNKAIGTFVSSPAYAQIYSRWYGRPEPFWTAKRLGIAGMVLLFLLAAAMAYWRYRAIVRLNRELSQNISERELVEKALRESRAMLKEILDTVPQSIFWKDGDGLYLGCNKVFALAAGLDDPEQIKGKTDFDLPWPREDAEAYRRDDREVFSGKVMKRHIIEPLLQADGKKLLIDTTKVPLLDENGRAYGVLGVYEDITERKRADEDRKELWERLRQSQKMEAIGTLAGGIAHDFNNILAIIFGYTELAMEHRTEPEALQKYLDAVHHAAVRAQDLVRQILDFSRKTEQSKEPLKMSTIVKETVKMLRSSIPTTIEIKTDIQSDGMTMADPTQIHQVIMNLCTNAYHAMRETGGVLAVSLDEIVLGPDEYSYADLEPGRYLRLEVSDTGCGIPEEIKERIFDPYFTTKKHGQGTGMGLAVVHGIVASHRGHITVYSVVGKGTIFHVYLPAEGGEDAGKTAAMEVPKTIHGHGERILFVDDEREIYEYAKEMLAKNGYRVTVCPSGVEAAALFQEHPDQYDLVITDMTMPHMTGAELAQKLLAIRPDIPIILCTGYSDLINREKALAMGVREYLQKPVLMRVLLETLQRNLAGENGGEPSSTPCRGD